MALPPAPSAEPVIQVLRRQAQRIPSAVALRFRGADISYSELIERADRVASALRARGVGPDVLVATYLDRSCELIATIVGILAAGGAYVPLDPVYPDRRLNDMLDVVSPRLVLTTNQRGKELVHRLADRRLLALALEELERGEVDQGGADRSSRAEDLAYVLFTSGSTGTPKGVAMPHGPLANLVAWQVASHREEAARTLQLAPATFDVSFQEIFATLCAGGTLVLSNDETRRDPARLIALLDAERVTRVFLPTSYLHAIAERARRRPPLSALRRIVCAGEQLQITDATRDWLREMPECRLENQYGPTEAHVVTSYVLPRDPDAWPRLPPIGRPLPHVSALLLDEAGRHVEAGRPGEIHLGGGCLARGYYHCEDATAERFVYGGPGATRIYRTGDLGAWTAEGELTFLGRNDRQVKIRGFRVECAEIEVTLLGHPEIAACAVVASPDVGGGNRLVAYIEERGGSTMRASSDHEPITSPLHPKWRAYLAERLPDHMIPSTSVMLAALPRTASGKVDRGALPAPSTRRPTLTSALALPRTEMERIVARVWRDLLQIDPIGIDDRFVELGGDSLLAASAIGQLAALVGIELPTIALFESPTVRALAAAIDAASSPSRSVASPDAPPESVEPVRARSRAVTRRERRRNARLRGKESQE